MRLTDNELAAIIHLAKAMAAADGKVESIELLVIARELSRFGVDSSKSGRCRLYRPHYCKRREISGLNYTYNYNLSQ